MREFQALIPHVRERVSDASELVSAALEAVGWPPQSELIPIASELSLAQRAVAEIIAPVGWFRCGQFAIWAS